MRRQFVLMICSTLALAVIPPAAILREPGPMHRATAPLLIASANGQDAAKAHVQEDFGNLPLYLVENRGQLDKRVAFYAQGSNTTIYFTGQGLTFAMSEKGQSRENQKSFPLQQTAMKSDLPQAAPRSRYVLALDFVNARADLRPTGRQQTSALFSYFKGSRDQWQAGLKSFSRVAYENVWPGIDLVFDGTVNRMKYTFIVKPGADPNQIRMSYRGATGLKVNPSGQLEVETPAGVLTDERPVAWQEEKGRKVGVSSAYLLEPVTSGGERGYGFSIGDYDPGRELVIDPEMMVYSGYIGGSNVDMGAGIAVDGAGNAYVTGETDSSDLPVAVGPDTSFNGGLRDAFVAKVRADGSGLVYCGYIGGSGRDFGQGIAVDGAGNAYVTGGTSSSDLPVRVGPGTSLEGIADVFVAKVSADGTGLVYCGYIGGSNVDIGNGIAVDSAGNAYVTGETRSSDLPVVVGPDMSFNGGGDDAFVAKVRADGTGLEYCGYIGGSLEDSGDGIAVDGAGNAYVTGQTFSSDLPVAVGPETTFNGGSVDAFVAKVRADGTGLVYCGYIGGSMADRGNGIAVDSAGNAYVTGDTLSSDFPVLVGPDTSFNSPSDAFVAKVRADGTGLVYCGYIGGSSGDSGRGIAVDGAGNAYVTGETNSPDFPVLVGPDTSFNGAGNGAGDAFVAKVRADGTGLVYCGYIGGSSGDSGRGIAVDGAGNAYVTGNTSSSDFPMVGGPDTSFNGGFLDAFVAKIAAPKLSPREAIGQLIDQVNALVASGDLKQNQGEALINKLEKAIKQLDRDHIKQTINQLESFIHKVDQLIDKGELTPAEGQPLIMAANDIIAELERL